MDVLLLMPPAFDGIIHKRYQTSCYDNTELVSKGCLPSAAARVYLLGKIILTMDLFIADPQ